MSTFSLRRFDSKTEKIAAECFDAPVTQYTWQMRNRRWGSESKPFEVMAVETEAVGVAKPGIGAANPNLPRAAHEKITSDFGFLLDLPIPPVFLWDRGENHTPYRATCISLYTMDAAREYGAIQGQLTIPQRNWISEIGAAVTVFDAWIGNNDRHPGNLLIEETKDDEPCVAIIDHAFSLSHGWGSQVRPPLQLPPLFVGLPVDRDKQTAMATAIIQIDEADIGARLNAIPDIFLESHIKDSIKNNLITGQHQLAAHFGIATKKT